MSDDTLWTEVWTDSAADGEFVLVLRALRDGTFVIVSPHSQNAIAERFATYADAVSWFCQDDYDQIEGRWFVNADEADAYESHTLGIPLADLLTIPPSVNILIRTLRIRIQELEHRLKQTASRPQSSDPPSVP